MKNLIYTIILLGFFSCSKELPFPNVNNDDLFVLNGILNPDSAPRVHLSKSCHITDTECIQNNVEDAQVFLKDDSGILLTELLHTNSGEYIAEGFEIDKQTKYQIEASHKSLASIKAETTSPNVFTSSLIEIDEQIYQDFLCRTFTIDIDDNPNETNYYLINGFVDILNGEHQEGTHDEINGYLFPHTGFLTQDVHAENNVLVSDVDIEPYPLDYIFLKDEAFNGEKYQLKFGMFDRDINYYKDFELEATVNVRSVSKDLYDYYRSITLYKLTSSNILAEPEQIFTNVENGLGILGSYTEKKFVIDLPESKFWFDGEMTIENQGCTAPCTVKFSAAMGENILPLWDFGDGTTSTERNPEHIYEEAGEYSISLNVTLGDDGFTSSTAIVIN